MGERRLPGFIEGITKDSAAFRTLGAASLALLAAGLDPKVASPFVIDVQAAIRARPELEALATLIGVLGSATLLIGGVAADAYRSRRIIQGGLLALAGTAAANLVFTEGPLFIAARIGGALASGLVVPFALASVAVAYQGIPRATALGVAYAALGLGSTLPPILLTITGPGGSDFVAYLAALVPAVAAAFVARRAIPDLRGTSPPRVAVVGRIAIWSFGVVAVAAGIAAFGAGWHPLRLVTLGLGIAALGVASVLEWRGRRRQTPIPISLRPVIVVLSAGLFVGIAQSVPLSLLPVFFQVVSGYGPIGSVIALAPVIVALVLSGLFVGWLLPRSSPRVLIGGGLVFVGLGDILLSAVASRGVSYLLFIGPFALVGAGFVVATTVRTAVIFASTPKDLPASAAALDEASVTLGSRIGVALSAILLTEVALSTYAAELPPGSDEAAALAPFHDLLIALGTPNFSGLVKGADPSMLGVYAAAYVEAIRNVLFFSGLLAVLAGFVAMVALGRRDPLTAVFGED